MLIRFLQTVASENPDFPFLAGQILHMAAPPAFVLDYLNDGRAVVMKTDDTERAVVPDVEQPEPVRTRKPRRRRVSSV